MSTKTVLFDQIVVDVRAGATITMAVSGMVELEND